MYSVESEIMQGKISTKASPVVTHRSAPSAIVSLFLGLMIVRLGLMLYSSSSQQGENEWLMKGLPRITEETGVLHDVSDKIDLMLVPFGSGTSEFGNLAWTDKLMAEQERLGSRIAAGRFAHNRSTKFKDVTAWGREIMQLQDSFKERMETRASVNAFSHTRSKSLPWTSSTALAGQEHESALSTMVGTDVWSAKSFVGADQALAGHESTMQLLESRKLAREQARLSKHSNPQRADDLIQVLDAQGEAKSQRAKDMHWMQGVPGSLQAEIDHTKRVLEFESRKAARQQNRLDKQRFAKATHDSFAAFFNARKKAQVKQRKERAWARGLPGAGQACAEHEQTMREVEDRKLARQQRRSEKHSFAQATKDGFVEFHEARKAARKIARSNRKWTSDLPGARQAYANHEQRMQDAEARKEARQRHRKLEKQDFAQATKDGFANFFQARKDETQLRKGSKWANGLPGSKQALARHEQTMQSLKRRAQQRQSNRVKKTTFAP